MYGKCRFCGESLHPADNVYPLGDTHTSCFTLQQTFERERPECLGGKHGRPAMGEWMNAAFAQLRRLLRLNP